MAPSSDIAAFRAVLRQSKNIILVAGAGLSAASGIPTFRGAGGYWRSFEATSLATPEAFDDNPGLVWQFYHYRREKVLACQPNNAHHVIARFLHPTYRTQIAPLAAQCTLITQNVDGLSPRAQQSIPLPPTGGRIIEMHGRLMETLCTECKDRNPDVRSPICAALAGTEVRTEAIKDTEGKYVPEADIPPEDLPRCEKDGCGGLLRPAVVWFGEAIPGLDEIESIVEQADLCLVVGTSSVVNPAAGFAGTVRQNGGKTAVFNIDSSRGDKYADFLFKGPCEVMLGEALGIEVPNEA